MRPTAMKIVAALARWVLAIAVVGAAPAAALAAEAYQPVEGQVRETIPAGPYLAAAYAFIWLAVLIYVLTVARRLRRVQADIEELRARMARDARA